MLNLWSTFWLQLSCCSMIMNQRFVSFPCLLLDTFLLTIPLSYTCSLLFTKGGKKTFLSLLPRARRCQPSSHWAVPQAHLAPWIVSLSAVGPLSPNKAGTTWPPEERSNQSKDKNKLTATVQGTAPRGTSPAWGQPEEGAKILLHPGRSLHKVTRGLRRTLRESLWQFCAQAVYCYELGKYILVVFNRNASQPLKDLSS